MVKNDFKPKRAINQYVSELRKRIKISKVILFGSAARGKMTKDSDLDLIVLSNSFKNMSFIKRLQLLSHARIGISRKVPMDILGYTPLEAKRLRLSSSMFKEVLEEGISIWES